MHYTKKFKEKVLKRYYETGAISETARKFKIPVSTLGTWVKVDKVSKGEDVPPTTTNGGNIPPVEPVNESAKAVVSNGVVSKEVVSKEVLTKEALVKEGLTVADFDIIIAKRENELRVLKEARRILLEELDSGNISLELERKSKNI